MEKIEKLEKLRAAMNNLGLSDDEKTEFYKHWLFTRRVPVRFGVVYRTKEEDQTVRSYIDLDRKAEIWGVEIDGIKIKRFMGKAKWLDAMSMSAQNGERLLTRKELQRFLSAEADFLSAFETLANEGIAHSFKCTEAPLLSSEIQKNKHCWGYQKGLDDFISSPGWQVLLDVDQENLYHSTID